jgi:peptide/nickel transport system ATP-binding protein
MPRCTPDTRWTGPFRSRWRSTARRTRTCAFCRHFAKSDSVPPSASATRTSSPGDNVSGSLSRALILRPKVLLLDEPTSALDASVQAEILNLLDELRARLGLTYVLVSHDLAVVAHVCDRLLVMRNGETVEETTAAALRRGDAENEYTRALILASQGFLRTRESAPTALSA